RWPTRRYEAATSLSDSFANTSATKLTTGRTGASISSETSPYRFASSGIPTDISPTLRHVPPDDHSPTMNSSSSSTLPTESQAPYSPTVRRELSARIAMHSSSKPSTPSAFDGPKQSCSTLPIYTTTPKYLNGTAMVRLESDSAKRSKVARNDNGQYCHCLSSNGRLKVFDNGQKRSAHFSNPNPPLYGSRNGDHDFLIGQSTNDSPTSRDKLASTKLLRLTAFVIPTSRTSSSMDMPNISSKTKLDTTTLPQPRSTRR